MVGLGDVLVLSVFCPQGHCVDLCNALWLSTCTHTHRHMLTILPELWRPPRLPSGKASASRAEDPGFESCLRQDFFGVESYQ